ncbi:hypothetical protein [Streptococcus agalactiae]|nr:hypothetical protein [Streptococcus agalactiae]
MLVALLLVEVGVELLGLTKFASVVVTPVGVVADVTLVVSSAST